MQPDQDGQIKLPLGWWWLDPLILKLLDLATWPGLAAPWIQQLGYLFYFVKRIIKFNLKIF